MYKHLKEHYLKNRSPFDFIVLDEAQDVSGFSSSNSAVNLRIDSDKVLVVEIKEGYDFKPDQNFTITLE